MLDLNKKTVSNLSKQQMQKVSGGICVLSTKKVCGVQIVASLTGATR